MGFQIVGAKDFLLGNDRQRGARGKVLRPVILCSLYEHNEGVAMDLATVRAVRATNVARAK